ncbi:MAG TPA: hypothetical protein VFH61_14185, partial [Thermoleophilia bacterium]|nr:hypothetical protein [Thermoleophilia bacterium]
TEEAPLETPVEETAPETADSVETPEPVAEPAPETPSFSVSDVDDDALFEDPRVKDRLARETESIRRKTQSAEREKAAKAALDDDNVIQAITQARNAQGEIDSAGLKQILGAVRGGSDWRATAILAEVSWAALPDAAKLSKATADIRTRLVEDAQAGRITIEEYAQGQFKAAVESYVENVERPKLRDEVEKAVRKEQQASQETARLRAAEQKNGSTGSPTDVAGQTNGAGPSNFAQAEQAWLDGDLSNADYAVWRTKEQEAGRLSGAR